MADALTTRLVVYKPGGGDPVARLFPTTWAATFVHNDPADSAMTVEVATQVPGERLNRGASWLLSDCEIAVEVNSGGTGDGFREVVNGRFLCVQEAHDGVQPTGTPIRSTLVPVSWLLTKAHVGPGSSAGKPQPEPGKRRFSGTVGAILRQLMDEAQNQGLLSTVRCVVQGSVDSRNVKWPTNALSVILDIGTDYLEIVRQFVASGYCDVYTQGTELVFRVPNSDRQTVEAVVLNTGAELLSVPRERDGSNLAHQALIMGDGGTAARASKSGEQGGSWGKWEMVTHLNGVKASNTKARDKALSILRLYASGRTTMSATLSLKPDASLPFRSYGLGGWVQVATQDGAAEVFQVTSLALSQPQTGPMTGALELGSRKIIPEKRLTTAVAKLSAGAGVTGLATPGVTKPPARISAPGADVRTYGAEGDGTTDDTAAVQDAIDSLSGAAGTVVLPPGEYICSGTLNVPSYTEFVGLGKSSRITFTGTGTFITLTNQREVKFRNLYMVATSTTATLFRLSNTFRCSWHDCYMAGQHTGPAGGGSYLGQTAVVFTGNAGDNFLYDCDITNFGVGVQVESIQNGIVGGKLGTNNVSVLGVGGGGFSVTGYTVMVAAVGATDAHIRIDGATGQWWLSHLWIEGCATAIQVGNATNGPSQFTLTDSKIAATTTVLDIRTARNPTITGLQIAGDSGNTATPTPVVIGTGAPMGVFYGDSTNTNQLALATFPAAWLVYIRQPGGAAAFRAPA